MFYFRQLAAQYKQYPISECGEQLQCLTENERIKVCSFYAKDGRYQFALSEVWLRSGAISRLQEAAKALPEEFALLVWDGWRPTELQAELYHHYYQQIERASGLQGEELEQEVLKFISKPTTDLSQPAPHLSGGAVDLTLLKNGVEVDMGGEFDELTERSQTLYYQDADNEAESLWHQSRELLAQVMNGAGFASNPYEWWHFDYGNQGWASCWDTDQAIYGARSLLQDLDQLL